MRLLHTKRLDFEEFYDDQIPKYAILSHRWGPVHEEILYTDLKSQTKKDTPGYTKVVNFCRLARVQSLDYCWVDTCCIDKTNSSELSEAINCMFSGYQRAAICCVYLEDVQPGADIVASTWFTRGWTLQELLAPRVVAFFDSQWQLIGTRIELKQQIFHASRIDEDLLYGSRQLEEYSVAQIMIWAAGRKTSRLEDEAYCLLGLFGVNMPLLYGEQAAAFQRLQEQILANGEDNSLFAWNADGLGEPGLATHTGILAPSPQAFIGSAAVIRGFATQRILFEVTNRGLMVLIHRSYDPQTLGELLQYAAGTIGTGVNAPLGLTIPLGCFQRASEPEQSNVHVTESFFLKLVLRNGRWLRAGLTKHFDRSFMAEYRGTHGLAYTNDYVRIYIHHDRKRPHSREADETTSRPSLAQSSRPLHWLHLRDKRDHRIGWDDAEAFRDQIQQSKKSHAVSRGEALPILQHELN